MTNAPFPTIAADALPWISTEQMIEVDRAMIEDFGIVLMQMMENAGRALAIVARRRFLADAPSGRVVWVLAGTGGNGGGALVCARRLAAWGADVRVWLTREAARLGEVPAHQLAIVERMGLPVSHEQLPRLDAGADAPALIVDGLLGYSLRGAPRGRAAELIRAAMAATLGLETATGAPILALDVPSGLDASSAERFDPAISATATLTLALPKRGLRAAAARASVGELYLADISVPPQLYASAVLGLAVVSPFSASDIVRVE